MASTVFSQEANARPCHQRMKGRQVLHGETNALRRPQVRRVAGRDDAASGANGTAHDYSLQRPAGFQSGCNVVGGRDASRRMSTTARPMVVASPSLSPQLRTSAHFFNTAAFSTTSQVQFVNASHNPVRGPAYRDGDLSLIKHTALREKTDLEFRAELFNVTNTPGFAQPSGAYGTAAFGSITATVTDPRVT